MNVAYGTILDRRFLPQALALYRSYERAVPAGRFYFFAMDDEAAAILSRLPIARGSVVPAREIRNERLEAQRPFRSFPEYCWASKPLAIRHMLDREAGADWACYLDSDMAFFGDPAPSLEAAAGGTIGLLTRHRFSAGLAHWAAIAGNHNAGFAAFRRGDEAERVLRRWFDDCLARPDRAGRKGETFDQKILDRIEADEANVRDLDDPGVNLAPWNADNHRVAEEGGLPFVDGVPVKLYHFQSLRMHSPRLYTLYNGDWRIGRALRRAVYRPYVRMLGAAVREIARAEPGYSPEAHPFAENWKQFLHLALLVGLGQRRLAVATGRDAA